MSGVFWVALELTNPKMGLITKLSSLVIMLARNALVAHRCRSETEKNILEDLFSSELSQFKKYHPFGNLKFNNLGIFQS